MARKAMRHKATLAPKFEVRRHNRCPLCGRVHAYMRMFDKYCSIEKFIPLKFEGFEMDCGVNKNQLNAIEIRRTSNYAKLAEMMTEKGLEMDSEDAPTDILDCWEAVDRSKTG